MRSLLHDPAFPMQMNLPGRTPPERGDSPGTPEAVRTEEKTSSGNDEVVAVIVTYFPKWAELTALVQSLNAQVSHIVILDNASGELPWHLLGSSGLSVIRFAQNLGLAAAQNEGIDIARRRKAGFVILFDQDSLPGPRLVETLRNSYLRGISSKLPIAAIGPLPVDHNLSRKALRPLQGREGELVRVDQIIGSGSLIPISSFDAIGTLRSELFIDYVDTEWALRARRAGLLCFMAPSVEMKHRFGEPATLLGWTFSVRTPARHYYLVRNSVWLWRQTWVPLSWKLWRGLRLAARLVFYALVAQPHLEHWRMMSLGFQHGWQGRLGRLP